MPAFEFRPAVKMEASARIALAGPSGSGKTFTALRIARGLGGTIGLVDTEHRSASKYADVFSFNHLPLASYSPEVLTEVLAAAAAQSIDVVIVDSLSHFWSGVDGMLEQVDKLGRRNSGGNQFGGWKDARPMERRMIEAMLGFPGHVIATMRTKTEYVVVENERGRKEPRKVGLKPEQRDGIEYEFDVVGDLDLDHVMTVSKTRMSTLSGLVVPSPGEELGAEIRAWLSDGAKAPNTTELRDRVLAATSVEEVRAVYKEAGELLLLGATVPLADGQAVQLGPWMVEFGNELAARTAAAAAGATAPPAAPSAAPAPDAPAASPVDREQALAAFLAEVMAADDPEVLRVLWVSVKERLEPSQHNTAAQACQARFKVLTAPPAPPADMGDEPPDDAGVPVGPDGVIDGTVVPPPAPAAEAENAAAPTGRRRSRSAG